MLNQLTFRPFVLIILLFVACNTEKRPDSSFDWQGHRGARGLYPENTLPGFFKGFGISH